MSETIIESSSKLAYNYCNINLEHKKSIVGSRIADCNITTNLGPLVFKAPVCCSNMKSVLTLDVCRLFDSREWFYVYHRIDGPEDVLAFARIANEEHFRCISISVGIGAEWLSLIDKLDSLELRIDYFTVDVSLSYNDNIIPIVRKIQALYPESYLIVGNGGTPEWIRWLENKNILSKKISSVSASILTAEFNRVRISNLIREYMDQRDYPDDFDRSFYN